VLALPPCNDTSCSVDDDNDEDNTPIYLRTNGAHVGVSFPTSSCGNNLSGVHVYTAATTTFNVR
jgi:hypothetical protein